MDEYKELYNRDQPDLMELFINEQNSFDGMNLDISPYDAETYIKIIDILLEFNLSYDHFFKNNVNIKDEDRYEYKLNIAQSIIRVAFSKEKSIYTKEKYYEYYFLKRVIDRDMEETRNKYGDDYKTLFRKEDLCDDIIKYMFFIFGNSMMIESFVKPVKRVLKTIGIYVDNTQINKNNSPGVTKGKDITVEQFNNLFDKINKGLTDNIPHVLRILLKLLHESVQKFFTVEKDNYSPLYTALIFNFIISPRVQMLYSLNPLQILFLRSLNRLIRNTCFNYKFDQNDSLASFNDYIEENNKKLQTFIKEKIISIKSDDDEVKNSLNDLFTDKYIIYPKFLFYFDSTLLCGTFQGGEAEIINFQEIKETTNKK